MWNYEMSLEELLVGTCGKTGNVSSWKTLNEKGNSVREYQFFQECKGNWLYISFSLSLFFELSCNLLQYCIYLQSLFFYKWWFLDLKRMPVYHQEQTIDKYLYQENIVEMSQFTLCFWIKRSSFNLPIDNYIVGIAYSGWY